MRPFHQPPPQNLSAWLDLATPDLVPSAQVRVRGEIESHYAEAVQAYRKTGSAEITAQASALADLGEARAAAARFGQEYLTRQDTLTIGALLKISGWEHFARCFFLLLVVGGYFLLLIFIPAYRERPQDAGNVFFGFAFIFYFLISPDFRLRKTGEIVLEGIDPPAECTRQILLQHFIINSIVGSILVLALGWGVYHTGAHEWVSLAFIIPILLISELRLLHLRQKLHRSAKISLL